MTLKEGQDRKMLEEMSRDRLLELFSLHVRNIWRVDGLYFLGIEERFSAEAATEIDSACWKVMGKIEARSLRKIFGVEIINPNSFIQLLKHTSWAFDLWEKEDCVLDNSAIFKVTSCGTQNTRIRKGLGVFPCKQVRYGYLEAFAKELDPDIEVKCRVCPPDKRPNGLWCEWEFRFKVAQAKTA
jgi:hypothetical protein